MLQKGFLRSNENAATTKNNKKFLAGIGAVLFVSGILLAMLQNTIGYLTLCAVIVGAVMISVGLWMDIFSKNKEKMKIFYNQKSQ